MSKQISRTIVNAALAHISQITVERENGSLRAVVTYVLHDDQGKQYETTKTMVVPLSGAAKTSLLNWVNANILTAIDTAEGL